jgi:hypothetical protein
MPEHSNESPVDDARRRVAEIAASQELPLDAVVREDRLRLVHRDGEWFAICHVELPLGRVRIDQPGGERG